MAHCRLAKNNFKKLLTMVDTSYIIISVGWLVGRLKRKEMIHMELNNNVILFAKTKQNAVIPSKREEDGAFDIYACFDEEYAVIKPHETRMIPTGIASAFASDYVAILKERGSTGSKGIGQRCGVIDSGFRGEWFVPLTNHNDKPLIISKNPEVCSVGSEVAIVYPYNKAICQCMMVEVPKLKIEEITYDELLKFESERGVGALGSSGK